MIAHVRRLLRQIAVRPTAPPVDIAWRRRMRDARCEAITQTRASLKAQRRLRDNPIENVLLGDRREGPCDG